MSYGYKGVLGLFEMFAIGVVLMCTGDRFQLGTLPRSLFEDREQMTEMV